MSFGIQTFNTAGNLNIDDTAVTYVYLGKYGLSGVGVQTVDVTCIGFPLVFFDIPYNMPNDDDPNSTNYSTTRWGAAVRKIESVGTNTWRITYNINYGAGSNPLMTMYMRVFGKLGDNYPGGSSDPFGFRVWAPDGKLVMDSGFRMLRLAGDTYSAEIALDWNMPNGSEAISKYDTNITLPFDLASKSICANVRGLTMYLYFIGEYYDPGAGYIVDQYEQVFYESLYYGQGNVLQARRAGTDSGRYDVEGGQLQVISTENANVVYTRLAVLDNTKFP